MLRATVRLGRIVAHPDHTGEYAVAIDGEIPFGPDDPEGVLEKVAELFHLADEALTREIDRGHEPTPTPRAETPPHRPTDSPGPESSGAGRSQSKPDAATPKQIQFLHSLAKRKGLSRDDFDAAICRVVGKAKRPDELTKREAGHVIEHLNHLESEATK